MISFVNYYALVHLRKTVSVESDATFCPGLKGITLATLVQKLLLYGLSFSLLLELFRSTI